jgi:hypothetical protein
MDMPLKTFSKGNKVSLKLHHLAHLKYEGQQLLYPLLILCKKALLLIYHLNLLFHHLPVGLHSLAGQMTPQRQNY